MIPFRRILGLTPDPPLDGVKSFERALKALEPTTEELKRKLDEDPCDDPKNHRFCRDFPYRSMLNSRRDTPNHG